MNQSIKNSKHVVFSWGKTGFGNNQFKPYAAKTVYGNFILRGELCLLHFTVFHFLHVYQNVEHQFATASAHTLKHAVCAQ